MSEGQPVPAKWGGGVIRRITPSEHAAGWCWVIVSQERRKGDGAVSAYSVTETVVSVGQRIKKNQIVGYRLYSGEYVNEQA